MIESKTGASSLREHDELVGQPGDGVALPAARRVLDQVAPARPVRGGVGQQPADDVELVVAGPDLRPLLPAGLLVLRLHHLGVVLQDVGQALARQHLAPQVVGLDAARVGRIAGAVVPAPVERQEPGRLPLEMPAELHLALVHGEVGHAAAEREQLLARVAIPLVLLDRVGRRLLGQAVLQLEGEDRQAVDEETDVEHPLRVVAAVEKLADDGEAVLLEAFPRLRVSGGRRAVEQLQVVRAVLDTVAQHVDGAALGDFALEPRQELASRRAVLVQRQCFSGLRLRRVQEGGELDPIDAELAVVVVGTAADPADTAVGGPCLSNLALLGRIAGMAGQRRADQPFETAFGGVRSHITSPE